MNNLILVHGRLYFSNQMNGLNCNNLQGWIIKLLIPCRFRLQLEVVFYGARQRKIRYTTKRFK